MTYGKYCMNIIELNFRFVRTFIQTYNLQIRNLNDILFLTRLASLSRRSIAAGTTPSYEKEVVTRYFI